MCHLVFQDLEQRGFLLQSPFQHDCCNSHQQNQPFHANPIQEIKGKRPEDEQTEQNKTLRLEGVGNNILHTAYLFMF